MNIDIRDYIKNNFKDSNIEEIKDSINASIESKDEVVLPGLGVLFEILWSHCSVDEQQNILTILHNNIREK